MILVAILGITACNPTHSHVGNGDYTVIKDPTCTTKGESQMICSECGEVAITVSVPATGHSEVVVPAVNPTCTTTGLTEGKYCSVCDTILVNQTVTDARPHNFERFVCTICGEKYTSWGLIYMSNGDGTCSVARIGYCTDRNVAISPISYRGDSVTSIDIGAFYRCDSLVSIVIPDSVITIGNTAFEDCRSLETVIIDGENTSIGIGAFYDCTNLTSIYFGGTIEQWNAVEKLDLWDENTGDYTIYCTDGTIAKDGTVTYN